MDIRNITTEPPEVENGQYLEQMFELQKELMVGYINIEGLPQYPININSKAGQVILKDMAARVTEELAEGYESTHLIVEMMESKGWNLNLLEEKEYKMLINHIQNSNEEQADATAFMIETLLYAGITPEDLREFLLKGEHGMDFEKIMVNLEDPQAPLLDTLQAAGFYLLQDFPKTPPLKLPDYNVYNLLRPEDNDKEDVRKYCPGFTKMSIEYHYHEATWLWQISYHLGVGRNYLKNKPWKQSQELSDEKLYYHHLMMAAIKLFGYHLMMNITSEQLYWLFYKKNQVNHFRQKSNY